jgi:Na+/proline symporter
MLLAVIVTVFVIKDKMDWSIAEVFSSVQSSSYSEWFFWGDWNDGRHFVKQFLAGMFITISMTGLDQDMMQKNLSCRNLKEAQKNMFWFSAILVFANLLFLGFGAMLYLFQDAAGLGDLAGGDELYPALALGGHLGSVAGILFIIGLVAAAYSSADSALTALTTSFCVDFLGMDKNQGPNDRRTRKLVHISFSFLLFLVILVFKWVNNDSVIAELFKVAGFTYGPLLGLYAFGLFTKRNVRDTWVPFIAVGAPILCYILQANSEQWFNGYTIGFELLLINGALTALLLWVTSLRSNA